MLELLKSITLAQAVAILLAVGAVVGALLTVTRSNPVSAVMSLVFTFFMLAGIYATLSAHFLAVLQVLVYAGAIMVLFIFVVMILNREEVEPVSFKGIITRALGVAAIGYLTFFVFAPMLWQGRATPLLGVPGEVPPEYGSVAWGGLSLFRDFVYPFEAISLLLLVAIVGGVIVSRSHKQEVESEEVARRLEVVRAATRQEPARLGPAPTQGAGDHGDVHASAGHH
jgi:NADH-quinone oxidoreductase subunit J